MPFVRRATPFLTDSAGPTGHFPIGATLSGATYCNGDDAVKEPCFEACPPGVPFSMFWFRRVAVPLRPAPALQFE
jgi:hypothetical protein